MPYYKPIRDIIEKLERAKKNAASFQSSGGRLLDFPKLILAAHVAYAIRKHLSVRPTISRRGAYEQLLMIVVRFAMGRQSEQEFEPSVRDLMLKALKVEVTVHPGGGIEFNPWVD